MFLCSVVWWSSVFVLEKTVKNYFLPNLYFPYMVLPSPATSSLQNVFSGQRCLTHSVVPLHCPFWFPWKKQNCTHISRYGKTIGLCVGIMTFSSGNSSMQCAFLMAAVCQGAIFMDLPLVFKGYHSWVALVSSESVCPFQLASSFESLGNHPVMSLSNLLCVLSKGTSVYPKRGVRYYSRPLAPNSSTGKVCPGVANIEDAAPRETVSMGRVMCPSSGSCIHRPPSHHRAQCVLFCDPPLGSASLYLWEIWKPSSGEIEWFFWDF